MSEENFQIRAGLAEVKPFEVIGISAITSQETATDDINALWERFFSESVGQKLPGRADDIIYAVYSDYEGDHEAPYRLTIGYRCDMKTPEGFHKIKIVSQNYAVMSAAGQQPKALLETWEAIWSSDLERAFQTDFEVYGPKFFEDGVHEVLIHVGLKE